LFGGRQGLDGARVIARILRQNALARGHGDQIPSEHGLLPGHFVPLAAQYGQGPKHEDKTGFLLEIAQNDPDGAFGRGLGVFGHELRPLLLIDVRLGPDDRHIDGVHNNQGQQQSEDLINKLGR